MEPFLITKLVTPTPLDMMPFSWVGIKYLISSSLGLVENTGFVLLTFEKVYILCVTIYFSRFELLD